jgi:hypothetical protein
MDGTPGSMFLLAPRGSRSYTLVCFWHTVLPISRRLAPPLGHVLFGPTVPGGALTRAGYVCAGGVCEVCPGPAGQAPWTTLGIQIYSTECAYMSWRYMAGRRDGKVSLALVLK